MMPIELWQNIESHLDSSLDGWRGRIDAFGQVDAVEKRASGRTWSNNETFEALVLAVLSSNTDWSRIAGVQTELTEPFAGFSLEAYATLPPEEITDRILPWFRERKAGSNTLETSLVRLIESARILSEHSRMHGTAESYFESLVRRRGGDPKQAALALGSPGKYKLPGFGVILAAEALKNLGFDVAKPDRHVKRAVASFGLVPTRNWSGSDRTVPKTPNLAVMEAVERIAIAIRKHVVFVDNAIWMLGARSELWLTNGELAKVAHATRSPYQR